MTKKPVVTIVGKKELTDRVHNLSGKKLSLSKIQIEEIINQSLEQIKEALINKEEIRFPGYFSFKTFMAKPRIAMNLKTKEKMNIPAKRRVKFSISSNLKELVAK